jgi:hypothetical protein
MCNKHYPLVSLTSLCSHYEIHHQRGFFMNFRPYNQIEDIYLTMMWLKRHWSPRDRDILDEFIRYTLKICKNDMHLLLHSFKFLKKQLRKDTEHHTWHPNSMWGEVLLAEVKQTSSPPSPTHKTMDQVLARKF